MHQTQWGRARSPSASDHFAQPEEVLRRQHRAMSEFEGEADLNVTSADFG